MCIEPSVCDTCNEDIGEADAHFVYLDKHYCGECQSTLRESHKFFECCECGVIVNGHMVVRTDENDYCQDCAPPICDENEWCSLECENAEGCIKCNHFAFMPEAQLEQWLKCVYRTAENDYCQTCPPMLDDEEPETRNGLEMLKDYEDEDEPETRNGLEMLKDYED
jgi:hypothetical protein